MEGYEVKGILQLYCIDTEVFSICRYGAADINKVTITFFNTYT